MQRLQNPELYREILSDQNHWFETCVVIGESGDLITEKGERILFGGEAIAVVASAPDQGFQEVYIRSITTRLHMFGNEPEIGGTPSAEINLVLQNVVGEIPKMALITPYVRACSADKKSEWIQQGVFYLDTRETTQNDDGITLLTIHGYDAMMMLEQEFEDPNGQWVYEVDPETGDVLDSTDVNAVLFIANKIGVQVDNRTWEIMTDGFRIPQPVGYTLREVLGYIAGAYAGCFIFTDVGDLRLVSITDIPEQIDYLIDELGNVITFGRNEENSVSGSSVSFNADVVDPDVDGYTSVDELVLTLEYSASGYQGATIYHSGPGMDTPEEIDEDWSTVIGTIYGGEWDVINGLVISKYEEDGTELLEPVTYQVFPVDIDLVVGMNRIWVNVGSMSLTYVVNNAVRILV